MKRRDLIKSLGAMGLISSMPAALVASQEILRHRNQPTVGRMPTIRFTMFMPGNYGGEWTSMILVHDPSHPKSDCWLEHVSRRDINSTVYQITHNIARVDGIRPDGTLDNLSYLVRTPENSFSYSYSSDRETSSLWSVRAKRMVLLHAIAMYPDYSTEHPKHFQRWGNAVTRACAVETEESIEKALGPWFHVPELTERK